MTTLKVCKQCCRKCEYLVTLLLLVPLLMIIISIRRLLEILQSMDDNAYLHIKVLYFVGEMVKRDREKYMFKIQCLSLFLKRATFGCNCHNI